MPLILLALVAVVPFLGLLHGQFLYDDFQVILHNPALAAVTRFVDCFTFVLKPSKPVTNFSLALGQWLGGGSIFAHRALSLLAHLACTWLLYFNLKHWARRFAIEVPAFWIAALFAIAPIHTESLGIVLFRMDCLGTLFTLAALLLWGRIDEGVARSWEWGALFVAIGLAQMSKEVFALILPLTLVAFAPRRFLALAAMEAVWAAALFALLRLDAGSNFPYAEVIGRGVQTFDEQWRLVARSTIEAAYKLASGRDLSILPPRVRGGGVPGIWMPVGIIGGLGGLLAGLLWAGGWWRAWGGALAAGLLVYAAIPNLNLGSEHYLYFPAAAVMALAVPFVWRRLGVVPLVIIFVAWGIATEKRLGVMQTRAGLYLAELESHPESVIAWNNVAAAMLESGDPKKAWPFLEHAREMSPRDPNVLVTDLLYRIRCEDIDEAERSLGAIERTYPGKPRTLAAFEYEVGRLAERKGECRRADAAFERAKRLDAENLSYRRTCEKGKG